MNDKYRYFTKIVRNMSLRRNRIVAELNDNEFEALRYISKHNGCKSKDIVDYLSVDKGLVSRIIKKLGENGYIEVFEGMDKRAKHLFILDKGLKLKLDSQEFESTYYKGLFESICLEDQESFLKILEIVYLRSKEIRKTGK